MNRLLAWFGLARRTECSILIDGGSYRRDRCVGLVHPKCGAGWCAEHCSTHCNGKCTPPPVPGVAPADELAVSDLVRLQRQISDTKQRSVVAIVMAGLAAIGVIWIPVFMSQPSRAPTQEIRWTRSSADGMATCWLAAPTGATVGTLTCCGWGGGAEKTTPICGVEAAAVELSPFAAISMSPDGHLRIGGVSVRFADGTTAAEPSTTITTTLPSQAAAAARGTPTIKVLRAGDYFLPELEMSDAAMERRDAARQQAAAPP